MEALKLECVAKDAATKEAVERVSQLQIALAASEARLEERVAEFNEFERQSKARAHEVQLAHEKDLRDMRVQAEEAAEAVKRDHAKKSAMARTLLSEREEEVRLLSARVAEQHEEISSGAPSDRKIFELAQSQARREATHGIHRYGDIHCLYCSMVCDELSRRDTREVAFQQLQSALASRDLDLARHQQSLAQLTAEVADLRRTHQRDGINMDYLKNIVVQYMTLPVQSSERNSLVSVVAMLLQFTPKELAAVQKSDREPLWGSKPAKEVKRFVAPPVIKTPPQQISDHAPSMVQSYVPPSGIIVGPATGVTAATHLEFSMGNSDSVAGDYAPPTSSGGRRLLSRHADSSPGATQAMSESDRDLHAQLATMDVLNVSTSDQDLAGNHHISSAHSPGSVGVGGPATVIIIEGSAPSSSRAI